MLFCERLLTELAIGIVYDLIYSCGLVQGLRNMLLVYIMQYKIQSKNVEVLVNKFKQDKKRCCDILTFQCISNEVTAMNYKFVISEGKSIKITKETNWRERRKKENR